MFDEAVCILLSSNTLGKGKVLTSTLIIGKKWGRLGSLTLVLEPILEKEKFKRVKPTNKLTLCHTLHMRRRLVNSRNSV